LHRAFANRGQRLDALISVWRSRSNSISPLFGNGGVFITRHRVRLNSDVPLSTRPIGHAGEAAGGRVIGGEPPIRQRSRRRWGLRHDQTTELLAWGHASRTTLVPASLRYFSQRASYNSFHV